MIKYFQYLAKKRLPILCVLFFACLIMFLSVNNRDVILEKYYLNDETFITGSDTIFLIYSIMICILSFTVPIGEFSFKMRDITQNQAYSLPMKRWKLYLSKVIFSFLEIIIPFTIAYFISCINIFIVGGEYYVKIMFLWYWLMVVFASALMVIITSFIFCQANNMLDGILFVGGWIMLIPVAMLIILTIVQRLDIVMIPYALFGVVDQFTVIFQDKVRVVQTGQYHTNYLKPTHYVIIVLLQVVMAVAASIHLFGATKHFRAEAVTEKSDSWIGYRVLIPVYGCGFICTLEILFSGVTLALAILLTYFAVAIYRRNFIFKNWKYWAYLGGCVLSEILVFVLCKI